MRFNTFTSFEQGKRIISSKKLSRLFLIKNHFVPGFEIFYFLSTFPESFCSLGDVWHQSMPDENGSEHDQPPGGDN